MNRDTTAMNRKDKTALMIRLEGKNVEQGGEEKRREEGKHEQNMLYS